MDAWLVRAGRNGEREGWAIELSLGGGGFREVPSLTPAKNREELNSIVASAFPGDSKNKIGNFSAQLWAMRSRIQVGDVVVMPLKNSGSLAIGRCISTYSYREDADPGQRHSIGVNWVRTDLPRSAVKQDLLYSLGAFMTVCRITRNDAAWRLEQLLETGIDPGSRQPLAPNATKTEQDSDETEVEGTVRPDIAAIARDGVRSWILENFVGHQLAELTAAILEAQGLKCVVSPPGADQGVDIVAGSGPLGLDEPRIIVQCKSETSQVGVDVVQRLQGAIAPTSAGSGGVQGLLVALGGVKKPGRDLLTNQRFNIKVWDADALLDNLFEVYDHLKSDIRNQIPMQRVWTMSSGASEG